MGLDTDSLEGSHPLGSLMLLSRGGGGGGGPLCPIILQKPFLNLNVHTFAVVALGCKALAQGIISSLLSIHLSFPA